MSADRASTDIEWREDPRYRVSDKEAVVTALFFVSYIVLTIGAAWLLGGNKSVDEIDMVFGFPGWLFWSTFVLGAVFCIVPYFLVKRFFTQMPLEPDGELPGATDAPYAPRDEG